MRRAFLRIGVFMAGASALAAGELKPMLGSTGKLLLEEKFDGAAVPPGWKRTTGVIAVADGALRIGELGSEHHAGAFRKALELQDCAIQVDFRFDGAKGWHLGFDPKVGELQKKGHLFSVVITPTGWSIIEHNDKANPQSKNVTHAKAAAKFERGQWYTLLLEVKADQVIAQIDGQPPLRATAPDFHVKKPALVFRVVGKDGESMALDNVSVWELK